MPGQNVVHTQLQRAIQRLWPVADVAVGSVIVGPVDRCVASAEHPFLRKVHEAIAASVSPSEKAELNAARSVRHHVRAVGERLLGWLGMVRVHFGDIFTFLGCRLPALRLVALHLLSNGLVRDGNRAHLRPDRIAIGMIAVMMGVEDIFHRLR